MAVAARMAARNGREFFVGAPCGRHKDAVECASPVWRAGRGSEGKPLLTGPLLARFVRAVCAGLNVTCERWSS